MNNLFKYKKRGYGSLIMKIIAQVRIVLVILEYEIVGFSVDASSEYLININYVQLVLFQMLPKINLLI